MELPDGRAARPGFALHIEKMQIVEQDLRAFGIDLLHLGFEQGEVVSETVIKFELHDAPASPLPDYLSPAGTSVSAVNVFLNRLQAGSTNG